MNRVFGLLFSGFATRLYGAALAIWVAAQVVSVFSASLSAATAAFPH